MYNTALLYSMPCCCLRPRCISVQHSTALLHHMLLSGLVVSVYSTVQHCCTTCCCLRSRRISKQYSVALLYHMLLVASVYRTLQRCCITCCYLGPQHINVQYSRALLYPTLLPQISSYQCTVHYSPAAVHAAASGLIVSVFVSVQHCCTTCCCLRPRH